MLGSTSLVKRLNSILSFIVLCLISTSCYSGYVDESGKSYGDYKSFSSEYDRKHDEIVRQIVPLPEPIMGSATIVIPSTTEWEAIVRPLLIEIGQNRPDRLVEQSDHLNGTALALPRYLEARNLFGEVTVVRGANQVAPIPPNGVAIRYGYDRSGVHLFMRTEAVPSETELTPRYWTRGGSYDAQEMGKLKVIEDELRKRVRGTS